MKTSRLHWNRRREARHDCDYKTISWIRSGARRIHRGWLNDQSWSGLSFVVPVEAGPSVGDEIELSAKSRGEKTPCKVVRITPVEENRSIVGCKKEVPGQALRERKPKRRAVKKLRASLSRTNGGLVTA